MAHKNKRNTRHRRFFTAGPWFSSLRSNMIPKYYAFISQIVPGMEVSASKLLSLRTKFFSTEEAWGRLGGKFYPFLSTSEKYWGPKSSSLRAICGQLFHLHLHCHRCCLLLIQFPCDQLTVCILTLNSDSPVMHLPSCLFLRHDCCTMSRRQIPANAATSINLPT